MAAVVMMFWLGGVSIPAELRETAVQIACTRTPIGRYADLDVLNQDKDQLL
jgi:phosphoribosyl-dephospho-CoA transferase